MKKVNSLFVLLSLLSLNIGASAQTLRLNVQKGQVFMHNVNLTTTLDIKAKDSNMNLTVPIAATMIYEVVSNNADTIVFTAYLNALKVDLDFMGKSFHFDSKKDSAENGESAFLFKLLYKPIEIHYDKRRKITNIVGLKDAFNSLNKKEEKVELDNVDIEDPVIGNITVEDGEIGVVMKDYEVTVDSVEVVGDDDGSGIAYAEDSVEFGTEVENDNDISAYFFPNKPDEEKKKKLEKIYEAFSLLIFPEKEIKKGSKWERRFAEESISSVTTYKVTEITNTQTTISSNTKNNIDFNKLLKELKWKADVKIKKHSSSGQMVFDNRTGWLDSSNLAYIFSANINMEGKKGTITLTINYDTSVQTISSIIDRVKIE
jgi:hypothetical protein